MLESLLALSILGLAILAIGVIRDLVLRMKQGRKARRSSYYWD